MRFGLGENALGAIDLRLIGAGVDFVEHVSFLHVRAFGEINFVQIAGDARSDINGGLGHGAAGEILLVYDWECPACDAYCRLVRIPPSVGTLRLVNAREPSVVIDEITQAGLDIDQGMVVKMRGRLYYGTEAIHILALTNSRADLFNKLSYYAFRSDMLSRILYPALRTCRNLLLKVMRMTKINNLGVTGNDRF